MKRMIERIRWYLEDKRAELGGICEFVRTCAFVWRYNLHHNYDYGKLLRLLEHKLGKMEEYFKETTIIGPKDKKRLTGEIGEALRLLRAYNADEYMDKYEAKLKQKYGRRIWYMEDKILSDPHPDPRFKDSVASIVRREKETNKNSDRLHKETIDFHQKADAERQADLEKFFKILATKMEGWWD